MVNTANSVYQNSAFVRDNIVKIVDGKGNFYGTGFFMEINKEVFCVTCHHCIYKLKEIFFEKDGVRYPCDWIENYSDMRQDISVLKPKDSNIPVKPLKYNQQVMPELKVFLWGFSTKDLSHFPSGLPVESGILSQDYITYHWLEEKFKGGKPWNLKPDLYVNVYQFEGKVDLGFSGAPVCYDGDKKIVGIFTAKDNSHGYVIPIETLLSKFEKNNLLTPYPNKDVKYLLEQGNMYFDKKEYSKALSYYDEIIIDSNYLSALCNKGRSFGALGKIKEAIDIFNLVLSIDPNFIFALNGLGVALYVLGRYEESKEIVDKALEINPNFIRALCNKGNVIGMLDNPLEAITWYDKALAIDPNFTNALYSKGGALDKLGKHEDAIEWYDKALAIDPYDIYALYNKGGALEKLGKHEDAIEWYDKALAIKQNHVDN